MDSVILSGICRCCAAEGPAKDLITEYHWMGEQEIYSEMLRECFDVSLCIPEKEASNGGICEVCITQLRNAYNFKKQVLLTEDMFKSKMGDVPMKNIKFLNEDYKANVKIEIYEDDSSSSDNSLDDADETEFEVPIKTEEIMMEDVLEDKPLKRAKPGPSRAKKPKIEAETSKRASQPDDPMVCQTCDQRFTTLFNKKRHLLNAHGIEARITTKKLCDHCGKLFFNAEYLAKHLAKGCPGLSSRFCVKCDLKFDTRSSMFTHMRERHWALYRVAKLQCPLCDDSFQNHQNHDRHLHDVHNTELSYEDHIFDCIQDLLSWKEKIEKENGFLFLKNTSSHGTYYYRCYPKDFIGKLQVDPKKNSCPARIDVQEQAGLYLVCYQSTHVCGIKTSKRKKDKANIVCPICAMELDSYDELNNHLSVTHDVAINTVDLDFKSYAGGATKGRRKKKKKGASSATPERTEHRINLTAILQNSNASPFRDKKMRGYSCLYCAKYFPDFRELRAHTAQQSEKDKLNTMIDYKLAYNPIKVDITDLMCTVCDTPMKDLNVLKDHLVSAHNKVIYREIKDTILPFRLHDGNVFACVVCSVVHVSFKNLYHHMSSHYRNYCCHKCGDGYITIAALRKHSKTHDIGNFPCSYCDKTYNSLSKKRNHEKGVHTGGWLRNKCPHCPKIFVSYYDRSEHLVREHDEAPVTYPCNACSKVYKKKFELNRHIKHHHLQQKSFMCDTCNAKFYSKRGLVDHVQRHLGGEAFTCDVCGKNFSRLRTLNEHVRGHEEDKRYQCEICKKTFMQKCSLKSHVRLHQDDLDIFKEFDDVKHLIDNRDLTLKQIAVESKQKEEAEKSATE